MSKTNLIEDELDLLIDSVLEAAPPDLKARCVKDDILVALRETCGIYDRDTLRIMLDYNYGAVDTALANAAPAAFVALLKDGKVPPFRKSWGYFIPIINIFYDMFSDDSPPAHLTDALNNMGLVCTLMLGFDMSLITSVGYDDATAVIKRCGNSFPNGTINGTGCWVKHDGPNGRSGERIIDLFFWCGNLAVCLLGSSLMMTIILSLVLSTTGDEADYHSARPGKVWWAYARWVYAWIFISLVGGIFCSTSVYHYAVEMKYRDTPTTNKYSPFMIPWRDSNFSEQSSIGVFDFIVVPLLFSLFGLGIALARMAKASNATPGRCTTPMKDDLPSEVTELGSVVN